ncbi:MAG: 4a-hydroxytetrahydrobiopterin dehydratase [Planctomycetota bacterium]
MAGNQPAPPRERINKVGRLAESQGHHPDIFLSWGKVKLIIWTHKINGLHKNDFILAAGADELFA